MKTLNRPEVSAVVVKTASMMVSLAGDIAFACPEVRHVFMYRNLDKNIISFAATMQGTPKVFRPMIVPKFLDFLKDLVSTSEEEVRATFELIMEEIGQMDLDISSSRWMTMFVAAHLLSFKSVRDKVHDILASISDRLLVVDR
jgi:hypothetical protein